MLFIKYFLSSPGISNQNREHPLRPLLSREIIPFSHSFNLLVIGFCRSPFNRNSFKAVIFFGRLKKRCSLSLLIGLVFEITDIGSYLISLTSYVAPQTLQLSPYCSSAPHLGHVPLINLSDKNIDSVSSNN